MVVSVVITGHQKVFTSCHQGHQQVFTIVIKLAPRIHESSQNHHLVVKGYQEKKNYQKVITSHHLSSVHLTKNFHMAKLPLQAYCVFTFVSEAQEFYEKISPSTLSD
jgi:hypothetical protein